MVVICRREEIGCVIYTNVGSVCSTRYGDRAVPTNFKNDTFLDLRPVKLKFYF